MTASADVHNLLRPIMKTIQADLTLCLKQFVHSRCMRETVELTNDLTLRILNVSQARLDVLLRLLQPLNCIKNLLKLQILCIVVVFDRCATYLARCSVRYGACSIIIAR